MVDVIQKSGSWFSYNGERIGQGKENVRKLLEANPEFLAEIEEKVRAKSQEANLVAEQEFEVDDEDDDFDLRLDDGEDA